MDLYNQEMRHGVDRLVKWRSAVDEAARRLTGAGTVGSAADRGSVLAAQVQSIFEGLGRDFDTTSLIPASIAGLSFEFARNSSVARAISQVDLAAKAMSSYGDVFSRQMESFAQAVRDALPPNWRDLDHDVRSQLVDMMVTRGWMLAWVPRQEVLEALAVSPDPAQLLLGYRTECVEDMRLCLGDVDHPELSGLVDALEEAIDSFEDGREIPAQAAATVVIAAVGHDHLGEARIGSLRATLRTHDPDTASLGYYRTAAVFRAVAVCLETYPTLQTPSEYNRNASAHSLNPKQYNRVNALLALLAAVGFVRELQWWLAKEQAAA